MALLKQGLTMSQRLPSSCIPQHLMLWSSCTHAHPSIFGCPPQEKYLIWLFRFVAARLWPTRQAKSMRTQVSVFSTLPHNQASILFQSVLSKVLLRDGLLFYILTVVVNVIETFIILVWLNPPDLFTGPAQQRFAANVPSVAVIASGRLFLGLSDFVSPPRCNIIGQLQD